MKLMKILYLQSMKRCLFLILFAFAFSYGQKGFEIANQMLLEYAENHTIEEVVDFCKKNVDKKDVMSKVVGKEENE